MPDVLSTAVEPTRRTILQLLASGPHTVNDLAANFSVTRSAISQHLGVLVEVGLVVNRKEGRQRFYSVVPAGMTVLRREMDRFWTTELDQLFTDATTLAAGRAPTDSVAGRPCRHVSTFVQVDPSPPRSRSDRTPTSSSVSSHSQAESRSEQPTTKERIMAKFILLYRGPATPMEEFTPEQFAEIGQAWEAWMGKVRAALADQGAPFAAGTSLRGDGTITDASDLSGYTVVEAANLEEAKSLCDGHPFLSDGTAKFAVDIFELGQM